MRFPVSEFAPGKTKFLIAILGTHLLGGEMMWLYQMADAVRYEMMTTAELRETFLLEGMFEPGKIEFAYVDLDRTVIGSAVPVRSALTLETQPELRAEYFLERRELGVFNVGGAGHGTSSTA